MRERDQILSAVGDAIERMAAAKLPQLAAADHQFLNLLDRFGSVQSGGAVGIVAGPVASVLQHLYTPSNSFQKASASFHGLRAIDDYIARMRLFFGLCSTSANPSTSVTGGT